MKKPRKQPFDLNDWEKETLQKAERGDAEAQREIGYHYSSRLRASEEQKAEGVKWYRKAAEQGDAESQYNLAECYAYAIGVSQDETESMNWLQKAAENGWPEACLRLGKRYLYLRNDVEAVKWLRKAEWGDALYLLGECYRYGWGVPQDEKEAAKWYRKAKQEEKEYGKPFPRNVTVECNVRF